MEKLESHHIENIFALTHLQEGIFFHYLKDRQNNNLYFEQLSLKITGAINRQHVENAWNAVIKTNEMLRVVFRWEKMEKPSQIILKRHSCILKFHDLSDIENDQKETLLLKIKKDDRNEGFDLNLVPFRIILCKMAEEQYVMIISNHHILYDGWSNGIILKEFFQVYHERIKGNLSFKLPAKPSFKEFIKWMQNLDRKKTEKYWSNYLAGFETTTEIPVKRKKAGTIGTRDYTIILEMDIQSKLDIFVKNNRVTLASIFYTAWGILLQRYCASEDVIFGTTVSGRSVGIKGIEDMVGLFINTVPLRIYSNPGETIINAVTRIDNVLHEREEFEHTPLVDIGGSKLLFDTILVIENYPLDNHLLPVNSPISVQSYAMVETTHYDLVIGIMPFNEIEIKFSFKQDLFDNDAIENMAGHFKTIIQKIITQPETVLSQIEIISIDEKNRLLYDFNNKGKAYPEYRGIQQIFEDQLGKIPGKIALVSSFHHITYKNFNENADHLGWILKNKGVGPNCLVGLMIERSIEMMIGLFGILKAGGAYLPIDSDYPPERVLYMLEDSQIQLTVTNRKCRKLTCSRQFPGEFIDIENIDSPIDKINQKAPRMFDDRSDLIYMIYTSGSTGKPKGVIIQKEGFSNLLRWYIEEFGIGKKDKSLLIAPISFDLSQKNLFSPFLVGGSLILSSPGIPDYRELVNIIHKEFITIINCAPSVFYPLVEFDSDMDFKRLHSLRAIILGGEPIRMAKLLPWVESTLFQCEIINTYGPTECTDIASFYRIPRNDYYLPQIISIGIPIPNVEIYILDKYLQVLPVIIPGELCIGGIGLSRGYHNNLSLTETKFAATPHLPAKKIYRTGDIARWLLDGNIEFLGRRDHQVKVRGLRIELGEIEAELTKHEKIKEALVISRQDDNGDNFLYVYIVLRAEHVKHGEGAITITGLQEYLRRQLPDYMVPAYFIYLERIPLTPSGKIDHRALPKPEIKMGQSYAAPRDQIEMELVKIWHTILDIKVQLNAIGIDDNFFQLGGHSLKVTSLASRIYKEFNVKIPLNEIFKRPTIRQLSGYIATSAQAKYSAIVPIEKKEYYILSPAQKRLFFLQQMENAGTVYNMLSIWVLTGPLDKNHIEDVFTKLIERHESLRTYFTIIDEKPVQRIHDMVNFEIAYHDLNGNKPGNGEDTIIKNFIRPFDLAKAPLIRVGLIRKSYQEHKLMLDMHHIAVDGTSVRLFINEFIQIYTGSQLSPVKLHYKDFSEWQREWFDSGGIKKQEKHWLDRFKDNTPRLLLLYDYERPVGQYFDFDRVVFKIDPEFTGRIKIFNSQTGITMYMVLLAVYIILLYRYSDQEDIIIGTGTVGRTHPDTEQIIGMFVNMLALRSHPTGYKTCHDFLEEVKDLVLAAFENQDYPFDELVRKLNKKREYGRNPLFDTEFTFQETGTPIIEIPGLKVEPYEYENSLLKFDLSLTAFENDGEIHLILGFSPRLFKRETIELMAGHFIEILNQLEGNKNMKLNEIKITRRLSEASNVFSQSDYTGFEF